MAANSGACKYIWQWIALGGGKEVAWRGAVVRVKAEGYFRPVSITSTTTTSTSDSMPLTGKINAVRTPRSILCR